MTESQDDARLPGLTVQRTVSYWHMQAQLTGTLDVDPATNCLVLRTPFGHIDELGGITFIDTLIDVAWPFGWTVAVHDNRTALIDATGQTAAHLGDEIILGGGSVATTDADVTSSCTGQDSVFVASELSHP
ncbi:hypothetical protein [Kribbella sp. NPDC049584]|uniref:hypothetical protein n=1 Tax=Kribbella sp. NPDC049584 TaxID=3154833 RepID=UPI00342A0989